MSVSRDARGFRQSISFRTVSSNTYDSHGIETKYETIVKRTRYTVTANVPSRAYPVMDQYVNGRVLAKSVTESYRVNVPETAHHGWGGESRQLGNRRFER